LYGPQGNTNYAYYALAAAQFKQQGAAACNASRTDGELPNKDCVFHDLTQGDMIIPCGQGPGGEFYDCFGAEGGSIIGELSSSDSKAEPAYKANGGIRLGDGAGIGGRYESV
jgi:hypothetical protein